MSLLFTALLMLCGLGAAIFATTASDRAGGVLALIGGFVVTAVFVHPQAVPDPAWTGSIAAGVGAFELFRRQARWLTPLCGGALAGLCAALLRSQGWAPAIALLIAALIPGVSACFAWRRKDFAPEALREEAMAFMIALSLSVAIIPEVMAGWQSALALNRTEGNSTNLIIANWVLVLSAVSVFLGGLYSLLRRR